MTRGAAALTILFLGVVLACARPAPTREDQAARAGRNGAARVLVDAHVPGVGWALVTTRGAIAGGAGFADVAGVRAADANTRFEAASIAKLVVAASVLQLVERKALDLDAPFDPGFPLRHPGTGAPVTLRMLLEHRAGLRDVPSELLVRAEDATLADFLERYLTTGGAPRPDAWLEAPPGTRVSYSNVGGALAALAVERAGGAPFRDHVARHLTGPLGMTSVTWSGASPPTATPYATRGERFVALPQASHAVYPVVDLRASAADLGRFARMMLREGELDGVRVLAPASVRALLGVDGAPPLAWQARTVAGRNVIGHEGEDAGASTALFLDLATHTGAVVLTNGDAFTSGDGPRILAFQSFLTDLLTAGAVLIR